MSTEFNPKTTGRAIGISVLIAVALGSLNFGGCSLCCGPYDREYGSYGGVIERNDPVYGRVGSVFSDPYATVGDSADSNVNEYGSDERRMRQENRRSRRKSLLDGTEESLPDPRSDEETTIDTATDEWRGRGFNTRSSLR